jgi:hypothetical protein
MFVLWHGVLEAMFGFCGGKLILSSEKEKREIVVVVVV